MKKILIALLVLMSYAGICEAAEISPEVIISPGSTVITANVSVGAENPYTHLTLTVTNNRRQIKGTSKN